jgi:hypothetical protein
MEQHIRKMEQHDRTILKKVVWLFQPDREVQTKTRLYDEKITQPEMEMAARVKNIVKEYAAQVEEALVGFRALVRFRALAVEVISRCPPILDQKRRKPVTWEGEFLCPGASCRRPSGCQ